MRQPENESPPPSSPEVERNILTEAIRSEDPGERSKIFSELTPDDFYLNAHRLLFEILKDRFAKGEPFDVATICAELNDSQRQWLNGDTVISIAADLGVAGSVSHSIKHLKSFTARRVAIEVAAAVTKAAHDPQRAVEDLAGLAGKILSAAQAVNQRAFGLEVVNASDWLITQPPVPDQILEDTLDAGDKLVVIGSSKLRKSFFFQQLSIALAAGRDFLNWRVPKARRVLYVQFEIRKHHSHRRTINLARAMGVHPEDLEDRLRIVPARGKRINGDDGLRPHIHNLGKIGISSDITLRG